MADEEETIQCMTAKEIKALAKPEFEANPDKFYPTKTFAKLGFHRARCPKCQSYFWRHTEKKELCGDSNCEGKYSFIGKGFLKEGQEPVTFAEAW